MLKDDGFGLGLELPYREEEAKARALTRLTFNLNGATMCAQNAQCRSKTQAIPVGLSREERFKQTGAHAGLHAAPSIAHFQHNTRASAQMGGVLKAGPFVCTERHQTRCNADLALLRMNGFGGIDYKIQDGLLQL